MMRRTVLTGNITDLRQIRHLGGRAQRKDSTGGGATAEFRCDENRKPDVRLGKSPQERFFQNTP